MEAISESLSLADNESMKINGEDSYLINKVPSWNRFALKAVTSAVFAGAGYALISASIPLVGVPMLALGAGTFVWSLIDTAMHHGENRYYRIPGYQMQSGRANPFSASTFLWPGYRVDETEAQSIIRATRGNASTGGQKEYRLNF